MVSFGPPSLAYGISGDGSVVVGGSSSGTPSTAYRWENGVKVNLAAKSAHDASADGLIVVGASGGGPGAEAFRWEDG